MTRLMQGLLIGILALIIGANLGTDLGQISGALMVVGAGLVAGPGVARWLNRLPKRGQHLFFWGIFGLTMIIELAVLTFLPVSVIDILWAGYPSL